MNTQDMSKHSFYSSLLKYGLVLFVFLLLVFAVYVIYQYQLRLTDGLLPDYGNRDEWGTFGDFFGGILNPIFGFGSFIALLVTIVYQAKELKLSRNELELSREELSKSANALAAQNKAIELQSFEQTFFSWLSTYRELLNSVSDTNNSRQSLLGREALYHLWKKNLSSAEILNTMYKVDMYGDYTQLKPEFDNSYDHTFKALSDYKKIETIAGDKQHTFANYIHNIWCFLYQEEEYQLDSLFRTAYRLISWIDSQQPERLDDKQKWLYISIFRSQLSWIEMVFFYYNGLTGSGKKFKILIEKYALFDNLTFDSDIGIKVMNKYFDTKNNYLETAFNSELARKISKFT